MTRRRPEAIRRIIFFGMIALTVLAIVLALLWNRPYTPTCSVLDTLPKEITLGKRYPVKIQITSPWKAKPTERTAQVTGDFTEVRQSWSLTSLGPGYATWTGTVELISLTKGTSQGMLQISADGLVESHPLGPSTVTGLLGNDETFTPNMSDYTPSHTTIPYALLGAIFFGLISGIGFIIVLKPRRKMTAPLSPEEELTTTLNRIESDESLGLTAKHQQISDGVRDFLSMAWKIHSTSRSSMELIGELRKDNALPDVMLTVLREYLMVADASKYAPADDAHSVETHLNAARRLLSISQSVHTEEPSQDV